MHTSPIKGEMLFNSWQGQDVCLLQSIHTDSSTHHSLYWMSRNGQVSRAWSWWPSSCKKSWSLIPSRAKQPCLNQALFTQPPTQWVPGTPFRGVKWPRMRLTAYLPYCRSYECMELYSYSIVWCLHKLSEIIIIINLNLFLPFRYKMVIFWKVLILTRDQSDLPQHFRDYYY